MSYARGAQLEPLHRMTGRTLSLTHIFFPILVLDLGVHAHLVDTFLGIPVHVVEAPSVQAVGLIVRRRTGIRSDIRVASRTNSGTNSRTSSRTGAAPGLLQLVGFQLVGGKVMPTNLGCGREAHPSATHGCVCEAFCSPLSNSWLATPLVLWFSSFGTSSVISSLRSCFRYANHFTSQGFAPGFRPPPVTKIQSLPSSDVSRVKCFLVHECHFDQSLFLPQVAVDAHGRWHNLCRQALHLVHTGRREDCERRYNQLGGNIYVVHLEWGCPRDDQEVPPMI